MNERAKVFAAGYRLNPSDRQYSSLHIYTDGFVVYSQGSPDKHLAVRDVLKDRPGFEEARSGDVSVFVVPMENLRLRLDDFPPLFVGLTPDGYHDHRQDDYYDIEGGLALIGAAVELIDSVGDGQHRWRNEQ